MPVEDVTSLQSHLQIGVMDKIAFPYNKSQIDPLMDQINNGFVRLQNEVLFKNMLQSGGDAQKMFSKELKLNFKKKKTYAEYGRIQFKR